MRRQSHIDNENRHEFTHAHATHAQSFVLMHVLSKVSVRPVSE